MSEGLIGSDDATAVVTHAEVDTLPDDQLPVDLEDGVEPDAASVVSDPIPADA